MNYNNDGFNERSIYIHNANDNRRLNNCNKKNDSSFAQMRVDENRNKVVTSNRDYFNLSTSTQVNKEKFVIMNKKINNLNTSTNKNMFKK